MTPTKQRIRVLGIQEAAWSAEDLLPPQNWGLESAYVSFPSFVPTGMPANSLMGVTIFQSNVSAGLPTVYPMDMPTMRAQVRDADQTQHWEMARQFADRARRVAGVKAVYCSASPDSLRVTVLTSDLDIARELELRAVFVELARQLPDTSVGDLSVIVADDPAVTLDDLGSPV